MAENTQLELELRVIPGAALLPILSVEEIYARADTFLLVALGEDRRIERKSARTATRDIGDYFSMWSNTPGGGIIAVGIENNGKLYGCKSLESVRLNETEKCHTIYCPDARIESRRVPVKNVHDQDDFVVLFHVKYRDDKVVHTVAGKAFTRVGDSLHGLSQEEIRELQISKGEISFELEDSTLVYPDDFDAELIAEFTKSVGKLDGHAMKHEPPEILSQRHLGSLKHGKFIPNNACCILFARDPIRLFPGCKLRFMRFDGEIERTGENYNLVKDIIIEGAIPRIISEAEKLIQSQLREYSALGKDGRFYVMPEYPLEAWYEGIVNACVHRSYNLRAMNIFVKMFDDRIEIISPGKLPPLVTPENIFEVHHPRNPFVMDALRYFGFVKCANEGTRRMREAMLQSKLPAPCFGESRDSGGNVRVTLQNSSKQRRRYVDTNAAERVVTTLVFKTLSEEHKRLINYVAEYGSITVAQGYRLLNRDWGTAKKRLEDLVTKGVLKWIHRKDIPHDPKARYVLNEAD